MTAALNDTNTKGVDAIYLDYQKAFDRVPHKRLLKKLAAYGIQGHLLAWIPSFLSNRQITVSIRGHSSKHGSAVSGVSQWSVIGPLLFIIYVNDISNKVSSHIYIMTQSYGLTSGVVLIVTYSDEYGLFYISMNC